MEVPCVADGLGIRPTVVGELPPQCAALMQTNVNVQDLTVRAMLERKREHLYHAAMLDPNTAATLTLPEIHDLVGKHLGVRYVYETVGEEPAMEDAPSARDLTSRLRQLPSALLADLGQAATGLDTQALAEVLETIRLHDPRAAEALTTIARDFDYKRIITLVKDARQA